MSVTYYIPTMFLKVEEDDKSVAECRQEFITFLHDLVGEHRLCSGT